MKVKDQIDTGTPEFQLYLAMHMRLRQCFPDYVRLFYYGKLYGYKKVTEAWEMGYVNNFIYSGHVKYNAFAGILKPSVFFCREGYEVYQSLFQIYQDILIQTLLTQNDVSPLVSSCRQRNSIEVHIDTQGENIADGTMEGGYLLVPTSVNHVSSV
nr:uncharacterized protein LOC113818490 [Penaeus vannamei]